MSTKEGTIFKEGESSKVSLTDKKRQYNKKSEEEKTPEYFNSREKNKESVQRNRQKEKQEQQQRTAEIKQLEARKADLKQQLENINVMKQLYKERYQETMDAYTIVPENEY
uniref:BZIP domain-containing protein n=1 Tax=Rhabditophanes sp. KR3021 TaxID=114890 RepID=A0AC35TXA9_9BILA